MPHDRAHRSHPARRSHVPRRGDRGRGRARGVVRGPGERRRHHRRARGPWPAGTVDMVLALPGVARRGEMLLHNHPSGRLEPSVADLNVAAQLHDGGVGFGIVDNEATKLYVWSRCPTATKSAASIRSRSSTPWARTGPSPACSAAMKTGRPSATWRPTWPTRTTTAACSCSRPAPAWASRSRIWCRRWPGPAPTASARS